MLIWKRSAHNVMRCYDWLIIRFPWSYGATYVLWCGDTVIGTYQSSEDAKNAAEALHNGPQAAILGVTLYGD